ncbi:unnamed protein product [Cunninghamella blakesleeana]
MISSICSIFGSLFLFFAFILNLFILIGQLSNKVFINAIYFVQVTDQQSSSSYNFGLWNYCQANQESVQSCQQPKPAYNWATAPGISQVLPGAQSGFINGLFIACFVLYFIGLGFSFIFWILSMPLCCTKRRGVSVSMTSLVFLNLLINLAALIFSLVFVLRGLYLLHNANSSYSGQAGNALWLSIGVVIALCASFIFYTGACCCIGTSGYRSRRKRTNQVDPTSRYSKMDLDHPIDQPYRPETTQPQPTMSSPMSGRRSYDLNQSVYQSVGQQTPRVLQQPYQADTTNTNNHPNTYSPVIQQQGFEHQPRPETHTHGDIRVPGFPPSSNKHGVNTAV